jgi:hypothetical protein
MGFEHPIRCRTTDRSKPKSIKVTVLLFFAISTERLHAKKDSTAGAGDRQHNTGKSSGDLEGKAAACGTISAE